MHLNRKESDYSFSQLAVRAGIASAASTRTPNDYFPVQVHYGVEDSQTMHANQAKPIFIHHARRECMLELVNPPVNPLRWVKKQEILPPGVSLPISESIPILFPAQEFRRDGPLVEYDQNSVSIHFDIVLASFFLLARFEEAQSNARDKFGRFPAARSAACRFGFIEQPIVDEYALILRSWIQFLNPQWVPQKKAGQILLSHDVDFVRTLPNMRKVVRAVVDQSKQVGFPRAIPAVFKNWKNERTDLSSSMYIQSIESIAQGSEKNGLKSIFFFKASRSSFYDSGYSTSHPVLKSVLHRLQQSGFTIGLHPGFYAFKNGKAIANEKWRLQNVLGDEIHHCRQHYLRFDIHQTWQAQEAAGFAFDHSMAYAEQTGFRCGTCHPYHPFDMQEQREMEIMEVPLIIMDSSLKDYMQLSIEDAHEKIIGLAERCINVEGTFTLLWHNTSFFNNWKPWGELYFSLLPVLSEMFPS